MEILDYQETPLGLLCLRRRELLSRPGVVVTEVTLDHVFLMSSYHTESERALASRALELHGGREALAVLVGGLGLGFTAREALKDRRVSHVEVVELLPAVIRWLEEGWIPDAAVLQADSRMVVSEGDVYAHLLGPASTPVDVILVDVDHAPDEVLDPGSEPFYTPAGLARVRAHLKPGGILGVWSTFPNDGFAKALGEVFDDVTVESLSWWNDLVDEQKEDTLFFAACGP